MLRGEFVLVVEAVAAGSAGEAGVDAAKQLAGERPASMDDARAEVARLVAAGSKRSDAVRQVSAATGLDRRQLYRPDQSRL
jgi:16S rRNA C1402 (ribose-2'-O) methylase RsmI